MANSRPCEDLVGSALPKIVASTSTYVFETADKTVLLLVRVYEEKKEVLVTLNLEIKG